MISWRVEQHYGFGAARISIRPEPHRTMPVGFADGIGALLGELTEGGPVAAMRRTAGEASAILLSLLILSAVIVTLSRDYSDVSAIEVVFLETPAPKPPVVIEEPIPIPLEIVKTQPPKPAAPRPPVQELVERPKPPVVEIVKAKPRARPKPVIPQIARLETPKPPAPQRVERELRELPRPIERPRVVFEAAKSKPPPTPGPPRMDRVTRAPADRANAARIAPRLDTPAVVAPNRPSDAPPERAFRVASNSKPRKGGRLRPLPGLAPTTVPSAPAAPVALAERAVRQLPKFHERRAPRPTAQLAKVAPSLATPIPNLASRAGRRSPDTPRGPVRSKGTGVAGVPLAELAACLSDREEDRLKQAVVAAVTTQEECVSRKGTYRFVETKNLNAFLMWIERAPARPVSDRCEELGYALECLERASRRAAR